MFRVHLKIKALERLKRRVPTGEAADFDRGLAHSGGECLTLHTRSCRGNRDLRSWCARGGHGGRDWSLSSHRGLLQRLLKFLADEDGNAVKDQQHDELNDDRASSKVMEDLLRFSCPVVDLQRKNRKVAHQVFRGVEDQE